MLNYSFNDSNPDVRFYGKKMILYLSPHQDFDPLCRKYLSADDSAKILGFLSKGGNLNDTLVKPNSARRCLLIQKFGFISQQLKRHLGRFHPVE